LSANNSTGRTRFGAESRTIEGPELTAADQTVLLALARGAIEATLAGDPEPRIPDIASALWRRGAFVSLHEHGGDLRGCIGHVNGDRSLGEVVRQVAVSAALSDPRFAPVTREELGELRIEISVLSDLVRVTAADVCRGSLVIGRDGVLVRRERTQAVLLPQVATEQGFGPEAFLNAVCRKAGLAAGSWREPETQVYTFTASVFKEIEEP
jgi:AmmeMemoRadiSam system protein A